jgi:hypothetical protein
LFGYFYDASVLFSIHYCRPIHSPKHNCFCFNSISSRNPLRLLLYLIINCFLFNLIQKDYLKGDDDDDEEIIANSNNNDEMSNNALNVNTADNADTQI